MSPRRLALLAGYVDIFCCCCCCSTNAVFVSLNQQEAQLNEVLSASNLDPTALTVVTRKLEVRLDALIIAGMHELSLCLPFLVFLGTVY